MQNTYSFELRKDKLTKKGLSPIRMIYSIKGQRIRLNTEVKIPELNWNHKDQCIIYVPEEKMGNENKNHLTKTDVLGLNSCLQKMIETISDIEYVFKGNKIIYTALMVKEAYIKNKLSSQTTKKDESYNLVYSYIDKYIEEQSTTLTQGTLTVFKTLKKHLISFQDFNQTPVLFRNMNRTFFKLFQNYLINEKNLRNTTTAKQLSTLKTLIRYAELSGTEINHGFKDFIIKREPLPIIALTQEELDALFYLDLSDKEAFILACRHNGEKYKISYPTLDRIRDIFCFMCETGLRISDTMNLCSNNILKDKLKITTKKTKTQLEIPLNSFSKAILDKYKDSATSPLPKLSDQKFNVYIKELCKLAKIDSLVEIVRFKGAERITDHFKKYQLCTAHVGRKTFCTLSLERGMSSEKTMLISGHKDYKSFKRYINISYNIAKNAMENTRGEIDIKRFINK